MSRVRVPSLTQSSEGVFAFAARLLQLGNDCIRRSESTLAFAGNRVTCDWAGHKLEAS
jgi:hypothetical protein